MGSAGYTSYFHNGLGQRVLKRYWSGNEVSYVYDEAGHVVEKCVVGVNDSCSDWDSQQIIWLGDIPVGAILKTIAHDWDGYVSWAYLELFAVHTDHLNTPRRLTRINDPNSTVVWRWDSDSFGVGAPDEDPDQDPDRVSYVFDLRFSGQVHDFETGLHYNYFRDYDPAVGRYVQSDPIGLEGGINTYTYVDGNPLSFVDPYGLQVVVPPRVQQHNRWNDPWRQARREFRGEDFGPGSLPPGIYPTPKPWCRIECPDDGGVCRPPPKDGVSVSGMPGCYQLCVDGPFLSDDRSSRSPPDARRGPRDATRGDWLDLFELLRGRRR